MKSKNWIILALCAFLAGGIFGLASGATRTFGTSGTYATLVAALDAASAGDVLNQVGASSETLTTAKSYSAANLTINGNGVDAISVVTSGSGAITFTGDGLAFSGCSDLRVPMRLNGADATFTNCTITHANGTLLPGTQSLILLSGAAMSVTFTGCTFNYHADAPTCTKIAEVGSSHDYQITFTSCVMQLGLYASSGATTSDIYATGCTMSTSNWTLSGSGFDKIYLTNCSMDGKSMALGQVADLQITGGTYTIGTSSNTYGPVTGMSIAYTVMATANKFIIDGATATNNQTTIQTDTEYSVFLMRKGGAPASASQFKNCTSTANSAFYYPWYALAVQSGDATSAAFSSTSITGNTFRGGAIMFYTGSTDAIQSSGLTISGNTFAPTYRMPWAGILAIKASTITANTFSGNMTGLAIIGSRTGVDDAISGDNLIYGNTWAVNADTCHIAALLLTSAGNKVYNNTISVTGTGQRSAIAVLETLPNDIYNNDIALTNGTAAISAFGETGTTGVYNNKITGTTSHVFDTGAAGAYSDTYMDYAGIYRYCKTLGAETYADAFTIGYSSLGLPIVAVKFSDNASSVENEPGLGLNGGIHGDEQPACMIVTAMLAKIAAGYAAGTSRYTTLGNAAELWFIPVINPDGYLGNHRVNIFGQDLNREFPDGYTNATDTQPGWYSCEAGNVWAFYEQNDIGVMAGFHNILNAAYYPWAASTTDISTNLRNTCIALADAYSTNAYDANAASTEASSLGAMAGTELDWMVRYGGAAAVTIEFPASKQLAVASLAARWTGMENSILTFLETGLNGNAGLVTHTSGGAVFTGVTVKIQGDTPGAVKTDANGYYFRAMKNGTSATLEFSGNGSTTATNASGTISGTTALSKTLAGTQTAPRAAYSQTAQEAPTFTEASNCAAASYTLVKDSGSLAATSFTDSLSWRMKWGGKTGLTSITANAFGSVNVGKNPATGRLVTGASAPLFWGTQPVYAANQDYVATTLDGLVALINAGALPSSTASDPATYYMIPAPAQHSQADMARHAIVQAEWERLSDANRAKVRMKIY